MRLGIMMLASTNPVALFGRASCLPVCLAYCVLVMLASCVACYLPVVWHRAIASYVCRSTLVSACFRRTFCLDAV